MVARRRTRVGMASKVDAIGRRVSELDVIATSIAVIAVVVVAGVVASSGSSRRRGWCAVLTRGERNVPLSVVSGSHRENCLCVVVGKGEKCQVGVKLKFWLRRDQSGVWLT